VLLTRWIDAHSASEIRSIGFLTLMPAQLIAMLTPPANSRSTVAPSAATESSFARSAVQAVQRVPVEAVSTSAAFRA
jgi:hypothetical protein